MNTYNLIAENEESTVVGEFQPNYGSQLPYQSEAELEEAFIQQLQGQAYERLTIHTEADLVDNLRRQLELLNDYRFTETEWQTFFRTQLAGANKGIVEKTAIIQEDHVQLLRRDDGTVKNIYLIDKEHIHNNRLQVINQYRSERSSQSSPKTLSTLSTLSTLNTPTPPPSRDTRYDVTVLVNGLPMVYIELKRRGEDIKQAFNQIDRYQRDSFWAGCGLYEYVQIFVISNGTLTKYYSNTTRKSHISEQAAKTPQARKQQTSNSFEFTSYWADRNNVPITDLRGFTQTFFAKHTLLNILTKYCIFTSDRMLMVMRPYQIAATEAILNRIQVSHNYRKYGTTEAGGYIWHTTGSGKTLTSFKTARIASRLAYVNKVLFVVDRKDLDYQTMKEYDKFEKGAANSNTNTAKLKKQLEDPNARIIITTIQKLATLIGKNKRRGEHFAAFDEETVFIFDECHRSQFGDMHAAITKHFKKYYIYGFTGTPIFPQNSTGSGRPDLRTTEQAFGAQLHTYTIVDAIRDKNVLPFKVDYISTMREEEDIKDEQVWDINREKALLAPARINNIVCYILDNFNRKTKRNDRSYSFRALQNIGEVAAARNRNSVEEVKQKIRLTGFNSIFCVQSIPAARTYYDAFQRLMGERPAAQRLRVATIFSFGQNEDEEENSESTEGLDASSRDFLDRAIGDYNKLFKTNYDTSTEKFQNYYKDVSLRMKNRELDLLIVVNMFLTGFDATTLNTLWVDKNLRMHGLLQAFSRTNRILNSIKTFGNVVCFRNLEKATNDCIALFGDKEAGGVVLLKSFEDYYHGYTDGKGKDVPGYAELTDALQEEFPLGKQIVGEEAQKRFIKLFSAILKLQNVLACFDQFAGKEVLSEMEEQDYRSIYIDLYREYRNRTKGETENVNDDIVFEMELVKQVEINIDYILELVRKYHDSHLEDKEIVVKIQKAINASPDLRNKRELIEEFIRNLTPQSDVDDDWNTYIRQEMAKQLQDIINSENLKEKETRTYIENAFRNGYVQESGTELADILPPMSRFTPSGDRQKKRENVLEKIRDFFDRFWDLVGSSTEEA
ncbi:MAG: type I restriction endonuclease subunit R [Alloprevotella sp.]|nr:type I restriction endonuclease subunit R [Alloprevotella sp.]